MKAVDFIRKFGWEKAKECLEFGKNYTDSDIRAKHDDLKQYVDAYELVQNFGGLNKALEMINNPICFGDGNFEVEVQLRKVIQLVEEVGIK